jgi:flavin reductase (DIM6/NTAB) family NADH-FMN oxidoreductase RutF
VHLGSNPALIGFILRPNDDVVRTTWRNIEDSGLYTINHVHQQLTEWTHYTSAKFSEVISELEQCGQTEQYIADFNAPFVKESDIKLRLKLKAKLPIELNGTVPVIGEVEHLLVPEHALDDVWQCDLASLDGMGVSGLTGYYSLIKVVHFPYARLEKLPDFETTEKS